MFMKEAVKKIMPPFIVEGISAHRRMKRQELISRRNSEVIKELLKGPRAIKLS